jgi:hypothetical protein
MEQSSSSEADSRSAFHEIFKLGSSFPCSQEPATDACHTADESLAVVRIPLNIL